MAAGGFYAAAGAAGRTSGDELPPALLRKLQVLDYPDLGSVSLSGEGFHKVVVWLEEEKIRFYEPKNRKGLREFGDNWYKHVSSYAKELNVVVELSEKDLAAKKRLLNGLASLAIHDVYRDKVDGGELKVAPPPKPVSGGAEDKQQLVDLVPELNKLLEQYQLPKLQPDAIDTDTVAALRCIKTRMSQKGKGSVDLDLESLPIAVDITDPEVKRAAGMLRLLHNIEMGQLQVNVNNVLNDLQQLTANPKTDSKLGRVGV